MYMYTITLYLTVVSFVCSGQHNVHCIRHDVDRGLVLLPCFDVGFLNGKMYLV